MDAPDSRSSAAASAVPISWAAGVRDAASEEILSPREKRILAFELLSVSLGFSVILTIGIDILISGSISWSRYTSLILIEVYLCAGMPIILWGHFWLVFSVLGPALAAGVFLWGAFLGDLSWFLAPALPVTLIFEGACVGAITLIRISRRKGLNVIGIVLAALTLLGAGIDASLSLYWRHAVSLSWSVIVLVAVIPVSGFFFYLHYRLLRRASLRKLFRL
jgi:hypothetical protein